MNYIYINFKDKRINEIIELEKNIFFDNFYSKLEIHKLLTCGAKIIGILQDKKIVSYAIYLKTITHIDLLKISTIPSYRNKGFAKSLLNHLSKNQTIFVEVNDNNFLALNWYCKNGFVKTRTRKNYYKNGDSCIELKLEGPKL